jgi:2-oxoglutarate dehydrogenase E2 component (dihydrolipoamide succinyltransferase)
MTDIVVPNVGESVSSGIIAGWMAADGAYVNEGDTLFELETDKATMEVPAPVSGVLKIGAAEGDEVEVGSAVGTIDESAQAPAGDAPAAEGSGEKKAASVADSPAAGVSSEPAKPAPAPKAPAASKAASPLSSGKPAASGGVTKARKLDDLSPAVRRLVEELGLDPSKIPAADPSGRLNKEDVQKYVQSGASGSASGGTKTQSPLAGELNPERQRRVPMTNLRKRIAEKLVESKQTSAHLTTFNEVDMKAVMDIRKTYKESFEKKHGIRLGFMSFFLKAAVKALREYPEVNAFVDGTDIIYNDFYDIGVALSSDRGLMTPVVRNVDQQGFAEIESTIMDFIQRAQKKKILPDELMGGTFTISNGGVFGSMLSTPIPNPPQTAVLGMHSIQQRPVVRDGEIVIRPMMYLALTYDHRILDGREAIGFLKSIKEAVEDPNSLLLDV